ncbi:MAG: cytochrome c oxidase subunit 2 [Gammaproteobacteria bacterium]|jgi:cytochrome c oxidase subunit 2
MEHYMSFVKPGFFRPTLSKALSVLGLAFVSSSAFAEMGLNMPVGVTAISKEVYQLHMAIFWICVVIGVAVFGVMFYSVFAHRKSRGAVAATFHHSTTVEIVWTIIPFVILMAIAIPAARTLVKMENTRGAEMSIKITGYQWKWHYDYVGEDVDYYSTLTSESNEARQLGSGIDVTKVENYLTDVDKPLIVPTNTKIRVLITSADVIHAWWMPAFAVKKDAIPGYINETWFEVQEPGTYRGKCAELCGRDHGFMPIVVIAMEPSEYKAWLEKQKPKSAKADTESSQLLAAAQ